LTLASFFKTGNPNSSKTSRLASSISLSAHGFKSLSLRCLHFLKKSLALVFGKSVVTAATESGMLFDDCICDEMQHHVHTCLILPPGSDAKPLHDADALSSE
jgi:hypothetical protein